MRSALNSKPLKRICMLLLAGVLISAASGDALAVADSSSAKPVPRDRIEKLNKVFELSGVEQASHQLSSQVFGERLSESGLPAEQMEMMQNIMNRVYEPEKWIETISQRMLNNYKPQYMDALVRWYQSPLGGKVVQGEVADLTAGMTAEKVEFQKRLKLFPPSEDRLELAETLEETLKLTDYTLDTLVVFIRIMFPYNDQFKGKSAKAITGTIRQELYDPVREQVLRTILFKYRDLSSKEFSRYVQFVRSAEGKWFHESYIKGSREALNHLAARVEKLLELIADEMASEKGESELLNEIVPPGQRYLFVQSRDPFAPLVDPKEGLIPVGGEDDSRMEFKKFADDLKNLPAIPMEVYKNLKRTNPRLYADLEYYGDLFSQETKVASLGQDDYADAVEKYKKLIQNANETKVSMVLSPIQTSYESLNLVGILWKNNQKLGLVETGDKKGHTVKEGDLLGPNFGVVDKIGQDEINVLEQSRDYLGNVLSRKKELELIKGSHEEG